jgi:uncharacterized protein
MTPRICAALVAAVIANPALAASFDCAKAATAIEKQVCADAELSTLDELLGRFYRGVLDVLQQSPCFKDDQRQWLGKVRNRCADSICLREAYLRRLGALSALQPGMALPKDLDLPDTLRLRWIIPPAEDQFATPKLNSRPFEASGTIGYVLDRGGYVLVAGDGSIHTLIPDIVLDGDSAIHLGVLKDMKIRVTVRGKHAIVNKSEPVFDNRACIIIHEQP